MADTLDKLYALQYKFAYQLNKNGDEDDALESLLDLMTKPRLSPYRRGLASLLIVSICISQGAYESNPIDAESFAKPAADAFREELADESMESRERVVALLEQAEAALEDIKGIKVARAIYEEMAGLVMRAKEIVDEDGEFWKNEKREKEENVMVDQAANGKAAAKDGKTRH